MAGADLCNLSLPLGCRLRALHILKDEAQQQLASVPIANESPLTATDNALQSTTFPVPHSLVAIHRSIPACEGSEFLQHEVLFTIGQIRSPASIPQLKQVILGGILPELTSTSCSAAAADGTNDGTGTGKPCVYLGEVARHEAIEALGAIGDASVIPFLEAVRGGHCGPPVDQSDTKDSVVTPSSPETNVPEREIAVKCASVVMTAALRETCELAIERLRLVSAVSSSPSERAPHASGSVDSSSEKKFSSIDPAPPHSEQRVPVLRAMLLGTQNPLFERYRAMFALRDLGTEDALDALCAALPRRSRTPNSNDNDAPRPQEGEKQAEPHSHTTHQGHEVATTSKPTPEDCHSTPHTAPPPIASGYCPHLEGDSCLLRHEVAFVLGQVESLHTVPALCESLADVGEHPMVRHESADALGTIVGEAMGLLDSGTDIEGSPSSSTVPSDCSTIRSAIALIDKLCHDPEALVRDSCVVAVEYWGLHKPTEEQAPRIAPDCEGIQHIG